jgi:hypothetical protein
MHYDTATISLGGSANTGNMTESLTTALDLQKPLASDLHGQGMQMIHALK